MSDADRQLLGRKFVPLHRWKEKDLYFDILLFSDCLIDLVSDQVLVFPRDRLLRAGIRHHVENSLQSNNRAHRVSIFVESWGSDASGAELDSDLNTIEFGAVHLNWEGPPPDKNPDFLSFRRAFYNITTAAYPPREMPPDEREFDTSRTSPVPPSFDSSPSLHLAINQEYNRHHSVDLLQRCDSLRRRNRRSSVDEAAVRAAVFLTTNQLHEEQEDSQDALLLEDVLRDFEALCESIFYHDAADGGASEGHTHSRPAVSAFGSPRRHAIHSLGRLIDLLQSLWTLTNSDVCETLEELDDRIAQVLSLFESETLPIYSAMKTVLMCYPNLKSREFESLVFPPHLTPHDYTCDHLLYRIKDIFKLPQSQNEVSPRPVSLETLLSPLDSSFPTSTLQVGALASLVPGTCSALLRCTPAANHSSLELDWEKSCNSGDETSRSTLIFELLPRMEVLVLQLNLVFDGSNYALVRVPFQAGFPQCQGQEGWVNSHHLTILPALPPCNSAAVCLMRCVQRVALRELALGFADYTTSESVKLDNIGLNVVCAFKRFENISHPRLAESFLRQYVFVARQALEKPDVVNRVVSSMLEYLRSPNFARNVQDVTAISYPVELGIRLRQLIYPVHKMFADEFGIDPDARALLEEFAVKTPDALMYWYLRSKIFIESVINLSVCEADAFIDTQVQRELDGDRSETIYQICDEQAPMTFSSLKRMLLDYLQPSAVQLLGNLNECIRRCFESFNGNAVESFPTLEPTILRSSQSFDDSDDDSSPRLARKMKPIASSKQSEATTTEIVFDTMSTSECPAVSPFVVPSHDGVDMIVAVRDISSSFSDPKTTALCVVEYSASVQRRWLAPSITPHCLKLNGGILSHVSGIVKSNDCHEYIFCPSVMLPDMRNGAVVSFSKVPLLLTDPKGKQLDARELDCFKMDLSSSTARRNSNLIKNQVFRNTGYSIKVRQYFLEIESSMLADTYVLWWYMDDSGRQLLPYISEHSQKLELEWGRFATAGTNEVFMLQDLPGKKWQIDFLQMIQRNTDTGSYRYIVRIDSGILMTMKSQLGDGKGSGGGGKGTAMGGKGSAEGVGELVAGE